ncbi:Flagellar hook-associated protein FlgK [Paramagnetospirillum magnetotacticum MS-1]|uniref:Flagellar hook-associated protein 1 n=1 Tax=Paramagnetospirillum magnetotacticum MS-1 TaxID=272627 RepID=A0A0C2YQ18_PARME|nr:flagellar hook-associated protein FlgK [Paramagnetospirillum magnetotacticum]KIL97213.1 Flagellar hook-associated protein FlgK [Paramagnetospirillum magnetotacticum MS-1]
MSLTLGLNTAVSGLLTNQKGLDVISQNVVNVNTKGYVRKQMTPESRVVAGVGAGVQQGALTRNVDEGLMRDIRRQTSTQGALDVTQTYYPRLEDMFGTVGSSTSISHQIETLQASFETLATQVNTPAFQSATVQTAKDMTDKFNEMTSQMQNLRLEADRALHDTTGLINNQLSDIFDLNQKIVRNNAIGGDIGDLQDKRDTALTALSKYMDIQYFERGDGAMGVYTKSGKTLVDKGPAVMSHVATTITDSWMTAAGGNFNKLTLSTSDAPDINADINDGEVRALLDIRDTIVPNLQAQIDEVASKLKDAVNQVHNRGTIFPTQNSKMVGTRQLQNPNNTALNGSNPQHIWYTGNDDTTIAMFDSSGNQIASTTLRTIMSSTSYTDAAGAATALDMSDSATTLGVKMTDVAAKIQSWMRQQSYQGNIMTAASASVDTGTMVIDSGDPSVTLAFRDQTATANGSSTTDARINFDVDGDNKADKQVAGFSNFFGLNDFFTAKVPDSIQDSDVVAKDFTLGAARSFTLSDPTGTIGNTISMAAGSSLYDIAAKINTQTQTNESAILSSSSLTTTSTSSISITDANGTIAQVTFGAATMTLKDIADAINAKGSSAQAKAVQIGPNAYGLRIWDNRGVPLNIEVNGGAIGVSNLKSYLGMQPSQMVEASVIPEGSGYRLRIRQTSDRELYLGATPDTLTPAGSFITELKMHTASSRKAGTTQVREDIQGSPAKVSRGAMQYNSDLGKYYLSEGDNTTALALGAAMSTKTNMATAGSLYAGSYNFAEHAAASIAQVSTDAAHSKDRQDYQTTLGQALDKQYASTSGVNLDEEVANMINFQQAYSASAKVISTLQEMLDVLVNIVK